MKSSLSHPTPWEIEVALQELQDTEDRRMTQALNSFYKNHYYQEKRKVHMKMMVVFATVFFAVLGVYWVISAIADRLGY